MRYLVPLLVVVFTVACATVPTDPQEAKVYHFIQKIAEIYKTRPPALMFGVASHGGAAEYRRGLLIIGPKLPTYQDWIWEKAIAHEMAHFFLGHDQWMAGPSSVYHQRELDADAMAVGILARAKQIPERDAWKQVYTYMANSRRAGVGLPQGHPPWEVKICDLVQRFPQHAAIVAPQERDACVR